jgi:hypothetical protein
MNILFDALNLPEQMIHEMALGIVDWYEIADKHGIDADTLDVLQAQPWFQNRVASVRTVLNAEGHEIRYKARIGYELTAEKLLAKTGDQHIQIRDLLDITKFFAEMADLKPKNDQAATQTGFGVKIVINNQAVVEPPGPDVITLDGVPRQDHLPPRPERLEKFVLRLPEPHLEPIDA